MASAAETGAEIGTALANVPIGTLITNVAMGIAEGQAALDVESIRNAQMMSGYGPNKIEGETLEMLDYRVAFGRDANGDPQLVSMMELGFTPVFYQFIDTLIEVKMAISARNETSTEEKKKGTQTTKTVRTAGWWWYRRSSVTVTSTPVDATYSNKYSYSAEGSSLVRTKLVPVPPPAILEERIRAIIDVERPKSDDEATDKATPIDTFRDMLFSGADTSSDTDTSAEEEGTK